MSGFGADNLRFEIYYDGSSPQLFAASIIGGTPLVRFTAPILGVKGPFWMRVKRTGNNWTQTWSADGVTFVTGAVFNDSLTLTAIGLYAGNDGTPAPAFITVVDYFRNLLASP